MRIRLTSIVAVMMLIERQNEDASDEHPSAAGRFFTLLGHTFQMWAYPGADLIKSGKTSIVQPVSKPSEEELHRHYEELVLPVIRDAVTLSLHAGVRQFIDDVRDRGALFKDIQQAQYGESIAPETFLTRAGQDWARLIVINERLMALTGLRDGG